MALPRLWALDDVTVTDPLPPLASPLLPIPPPPRRDASTSPPCRCHLFFLPLTGDARAIRCSLYACIGQREEESDGATRRTHVYVECQPSHAHECTHARTHATNTTCTARTCRHRRRRRRRRGRRGRCRRCGRFTLRRVIKFRISRFHYVSPAPRVVRVKRMLLLLLDALYLFVIDETRR